MYFFALKLEKEAIGGQNHATATRQPGEHTFEGQNRVTTTGRPGKHLKHVGRNQYWRFDMDMACLTFFVDIRRHVYNPHAVHIELVKFVEENEERIHGYYAETINLNSDKFLEIILVDAAFIIEVLLRYWFDDLITPNDRIFRKPWMINDINQDLLLLENQLPFFVLEDLFEMTNINLVFNENETWSYPFICLTFHWFLNSNKIQELVSYQEKSLRHTKRKFEFIPSATELHEAGVKFKQCFGNPTEKIYDSTKHLLQNIMAYEQCHCEVKFVTDYTVILVYLTNTSKDVELLVKPKVIENWLSDNNDVSNLFNGIDKEVILDTNAYYFTKVHKELNDYYKICSHKWKATLRHNYCNTPWQVLSIIVAAILLGLTFIQSLCSLVSCHK
ncbi:hypothetical protein HYC85_023235 [Camellia sinensis]|uniref:Uncharacterized protein n=1 Tax=Camellia sinensis TaxID=4442 RepID=A0A7J7GHV1_CAMSI|nr:hypothetical protein HYC85_023235 [Camellia sinensis]